jgi:hypothetical protein
MPCKRLSCQRFRMKAKAGLKMVRPPRRLQTTMYGRGAPRHVKPDKEMATEDAHAQSIGTMPRGYAIEEL